MDKRRAIQIMTKAAQLYKEHLEDQKVLFLSLIHISFPMEVKKQADIGWIPLAKVISMKMRRYFSAK